MPELIDTERQEDRSAPGTRVRGALGRLRVRRQAIVAVLGSSALVGAVLAIATWSVTLGFPAAGLDPGWHAGLYMAAQRGLHAGTQIAFTYGPLGFLAVPELWYSGLGTLAYLYEALLYVLLAVTMIVSLRRATGVAGAALAAFVVLALAPVADVPTVLAAAWCLMALQKERAPYALGVVAIGGGLLGAVESLIEFRPGPVIVVMCAITLAVCERRRRHLVMFGACLVLTGLVLWFASAQGVGNMGPFLRRSLAVVSGYSEAMALPSGGRLWLALVLCLAVVAAAVLVASDIRVRRIAAGVVAALVCFALFKEGFVRGDQYHTPKFFQGLLILTAAGVVGSRRHRVALLSALAGLALVTAHYSPPPVATFNPLHHIRTVADQLRTVTDARRRNTQLFYAEIVMAAQYRLPESMLTLLRGHSVHIDPWDTAVAWLYHLDWDPVPVFQGYTAYTSSLDTLNAAALASPRGPERILRENTVLVDAYHRGAGIDGRLGVWDPPAQATAMLCHYAPVATSSRWQVLSRVADRCGPAQLMRSVSASSGQTVDIPPAPAGEALVARIHGLGVSGLERLQTTLFRARLRWARVNGTEVVRVVPATASDGLLLDLAPSSDYPAPFALSPGVRTLSFSGFSGRLRIDVYRMAVAPLSAG